MSFCLEKLDDPFYKVCMLLLILQLIHSSMQILIYQKIGPKTFSCKYTNWTIDTSNSLPFHKLLSLLLNTNWICLEKNNRSSTEKFLFFRWGAHIVHTNIRQTWILHPLSDVSQLYLYKYQLSIFPILDSDYNKWRKHITPCWKQIFD